MGNYLKMHITDKENLCQNIYEDEIVRSADYLIEYAEWAKLGQKDIPAACYTNFRDALFHFRKMANCSEEHEVMQQAFAVKEHLKRARTDAKTSVLFYYAFLANQLIKDDTVEALVKIRLREYLHKMKNVIMMSRINGMMMSETSIMKVNEEEVIKILEEYFDLLRDYCLNQAKALMKKNNVHDTDTKYYS